MDAIVVAVLLVLVAGASSVWGADSRELSARRDELAGYVRPWW